MNSKRLKILFIVPSYKPAYIYGGPIRSVAALCEALIIAGHEVSVFTTTANGKVELEVIPGKEYNVEGVKVIYFKRQTTDHTNVSVGLLRKVWSQCKEFDIIHIQSWWNFATIFSAIVCRIKSLIPIISPRGSLIPYTFGYRHVRSKKWLHGIVGRHLLEYSIMHFTSIQEKEDAGKFMNTRNSFVISNILSLPDKILGQKKQKGLKLVFIGRIDPKKNLEFILQSLQSMGNSDQISLDIVGAGEENYIAKLKQMSRTLVNVTWRGEIDGELKYRLLAESDLLVLLSHNENYGNVVFEALCQGTPVIISKYVGAKDYVEKNKLGWVIDLTEKEFKETLTEALLQRTKLKDMQQRAPDCIARDFNSGQQVIEYEKMYHQIEHTNR
ncbi:MAG: glycosyltransferase [Saprospiraceae bacterium]